MKTDWLYYIIIGVMVCCVVVAVQYYIEFHYKECISNPLTYASRSYEKRFTKPFVGSGYFVMGGQSPIIYFNSSGTYVVTNKLERFAINNSSY